MAAHRPSFPRLTSVAFSFPLFHRPTHLQRISRREYATSRSFYAGTMAMCAIASARARDGASFSSQYGLNEQSLQSSSETFRQLARSAIPKDLEAAKGLDFMRACALLALTSIQLGDIPSMHQHLGAYHTLVSMDSLQDETRWPKGLSVVETEERRRLVRSLGDKAPDIQSYGHRARLTLIVLVHLHARHLFLHCLERCASEQGVTMQCAIPL